MSIVVTIVGNEIWNSAGNTTVEKATNYYTSQGGYADSKFGKVTLDKRSAKNSRQHGIGVAKVQAYAVVKDVLEKGTITLPMDYYNTNPNKEYKTGMIAADVVISGQTYTCVVTVCLNNDGLIRVWNHEVTPYTNTKPQGVSITNHVSGGKTTPHQHQGAMAKVAKEFQKNNKENNESKTNKNMKKNVVKINENTLKQIVVDSVKKVLKESAFRGLDDDGKPTHYATQDDDEIDYAMEQCAKAAMEFILEKESQMGNEWFNEFSEKCSHDGMFNSLDEKQLKECYIKGNKASHSCVYKGNGVQLGRIPTHYGGEWQD